MIQVVTGGQVRVLAMSCRRIMAGEYEDRGADTIFGSSEYDNDDGIACPKNGLLCGVERISPLATPVNESMT